MTWDIQPGDAGQVLTQARNALFVMVGMLAVIWVLQIVNWADQYHLTSSYGIQPRDIGGLPDILSAPFLHVSWAHIEANSGPLFIFGFLAAYRGLAKFAGVTVLVIMTSGLAAWLFGGSNTIVVGASGLVFGYFGYIMVRGIFDRHALDLLIGAVMALCFAYQFTVLLPKAGISWQAHIGGLVGGILAGWIFRDRRAPDSGPRKPRAKAPGKKTPGKAVQPASSGVPQPYASGPRADLHKQLDDLGL